MNNDYVLYGEPVKGWILARSLKEQHGALPGDWVLAFKDFFLNREDFMPSFFFKKIPTDLESSMEEDFELYLKEIDIFEDSMKADPQIGYAFYGSCIQDGFDPFKDDFHIWVAERICSSAYSGQKSLTKKDLRRMMKMFVSIEEYEKAALVRDVLDNKKIKDVF